MQVEQAVWTPESGPGLEGWTHGLLTPDADLILCFWSAPEKVVSPFVKELALANRNVCLVGCSTSGEIVGHDVREGVVSLTRIRFESGDARCETAAVALESYGSSREAGRELAGSLRPQGLRHVFVLSDGLGVNGSELALGMDEVLPKDVAVTGGLAGDMDRFQHTATLYNDTLASGMIVAVGFYGRSLGFGYGSVGGWDVFGPERLITSSEGNVLHEMDGESALDLYERYLGKDADGLPATGLLFPLSIRINDGGRVVRTILAVDREKRTMTFAGDVPEGAYAQLMRANFNRLVDGAMDAAEAAGCEQGKAGLALLVSCVGRRLILGQMTEEEVEAVADVLGRTVPLAGFYSYGELAPACFGECCELHNQTMTVTTICEGGDV